MDYLLIKNLSRIIIEGVAALRGHLSGAKHLENTSAPLDNSDFSIQNGKWRKRKAADRLTVHQSKLSKRERTKQNKLARAIPILAQHTEAKYEETETYTSGGLRRVRPYCTVLYCTALYCTDLYRCGPTTSPSPRTPRGAGAARS